MSNEEKEDKTPEDKPEEHKILCIVMDRTGDTHQELLVPEAVALARDEMGKGKWLRTVNLEGQSNIIRDVKELANDDIAYGIFEDVSELEMIAALQGG